MKKIKSLAVLFCFFTFLLPAVAQKTFPFNGVYDHQEGYYAFVNACIYKSYNQRIDKATLIIREGKVVACGTNIDIPEGITTIDLQGEFIYPSFIDIYSNYGLPEPTSAGKAPDKKPQMLSNKKGPFNWNEAMRTEFNASEVFQPDAKEAKAYRDLGFGAVLTHQMDGISRGTSAFVLLGDEQPHEMILQQSAAHHLSFDKGKSTQAYPSSLMGAIALIRQTYLDGEWYKSIGHNEEVNLSLQAWNDVQDMPQIFEVREKLEALRALKLAKEFGKQYIIMGAGDEYQRLDELNATGSKYILPLAFPDAYDVEDPIDALEVSLEDLKHWELAPANPARVAASKAEFSLSANGLDKKTDFHKNLQKAIEYGLSKEAALKALTFTPAQWLNIYDKIGSLEKGKFANFIITSGDVFDKETTIYHNWVKGKVNILKSLAAPGPEGDYQLSIGAETYKLQLSTEKQQFKLQLVLDDTTKIKVTHSLQYPLITMNFSLPDDDKKTRSLSGAILDKQWAGTGTDGDGNWFSWSAAYTGAAEADTTEKKDSTTQKELGEIIYPFTAYGTTDIPKEQNFVVKNATVWTNEDAGILQNTDVLVKNGKIAAVGKSLPVEGALVIDGSGKHLSCGIIDEHTHIAISRGVNESTQASSAEVRIGDVINSDDVNIYRNLSGGVTTVQQLHGSANPIGGQSAIIKLRWGYAPEQLKFENADGFIKFALGENVKQTNWGDDYSIRFPQTRMGVEQVFEDYFTQAAAYGRLKYSGKPYRKDLDLETVLEILEKKRFVTCHSYQQGEINMLMKVAERHNFRINTFTHILEGYKVADKMAAHGAGGSTFSDWWTYKFEVIDAIPYNGALMYEQGVVTAFNSDDAEMARRLNQEAAKAVLFGNVSEEEAWKFVTLNPAKLLHIDHRVGSIKAGKDADLVLWSDNPLSVYAKAEITWVDGIKFFDRKENEDRQQYIQKERARLIQKSIAEKKDGGKTQKVKSKPEKFYHCDDIEDEGTLYNHH